MNLNPTTDNNQGNYLVPECDEHLENLRAIGNCSVAELCKHNPDFLVFPQSFGIYHDDIENNSIFSLQDGVLTTRNMMGFVGRNETQLTISSRFSKEEKNDYFLHYMLQRVFSINIFKFDQTPEKENIWDFLLYLFPFFLKKAYSQGIYKTYLRNRYNDSHLKGSLDVNRHLRLNIPFCGRVAYSVREYSYDNPVTQLIRHTIEHIKSHPFGSGILSSDSEIRDIVEKIYSITQATYNRNNRRRVIVDNLKTVSHPYFTEYRSLQKICLRILNREKLTFGMQSDLVYGLLFDGAWLWEEYLNTILARDFIHPENKTGKHREYLFENSQSIFPDFISKHPPMIVGDAKYIPLERTSCTENSERALNLYYKTITYMYRFSSNCGLLLFPHPDTLFEKELKIKNTKGVLKEVGLAIPQHANSFKEFQSCMCRNEEEFRRSITNWNPDK